MKFFLLVLSVSFSIVQCRVPPIKTKTLGKFYPLDDKAPIELPGYEVGYIRMAIKNSLYTALEHFKNKALYRALKSEYDNYMLMKDFSMNPKCYDSFELIGYNTKHKYQIIVIMELMENRDMEKIIENNYAARQGYTMETTVSFMVQILYMIQAFAMRQRAYYDWSPKNFMIQSDGILRLFDMALVGNLFEEDGKHIQPSPNVALFTWGTDNYVSRRNHKEFYQTQSTSVESLLFMRKDFRESSYIKPLNAETTLDNLYLAKECYIKSLLEGDSGADIAKFAEIVNNMKFDETPDYLYLRRLLIDSLPEKKLKVVVKTEPLYKDDILYSIDESDDSDHPDSDDSSDSGFVMKSSRPQKSVSLPRIRSSQRSPVTPIQSHHVKSFESLEHERRPPSRSSPLRDPATPVDDSGRRPSLRSNLLVVPSPSLDFTDQGRLSAHAQPQSFAGPSRIQSPIREPTRHQAQYYPSSEEEDSSDEELVMMSPRKRQ